MTIMLIVLAMCLDYDDRGNDNDDDNDDCCDSNDL